MPHRLRNRTLYAPILTGLILSLSPMAVLAADEEAFELGEQVFTEIATPQCAICHTLDAAGAAGEIGPNLDEMKPTEEKVRLAVTGGVGAMPAYSEILTPEQIDAVALYVSKATGGGE